MLTITTTNNLDGYEVVEYLGIVTGEAVSGINTVSYTHLDVYKRQVHEAEAASEQSGVEDHEEDERGNDVALDGHVRGCLLYTSYSHH